MQLNLKFKMNASLYLRNPEDSELGKKILEQSIIMIHRLGLETFTFRKLALEIGTTEAGVYRYFENKHRLLLYIVDWYWSWQEYRMLYETNNIEDPVIKISTAVRLLSLAVEDDSSTSYINENLLYEIVMAEGAKAYLTKHVNADNKLKLFKPYKDLCGLLAKFISDLNPEYAYPKALSSTIVEMAHSQNYYMKYLPALTDFNHSNSQEQLAKFLEELIYKSLKP